jgi:branched-subunit amino acid transport protein
MSNELIWLTIAGMALATLATRATPLLIMRGEPPPWLRRWLSLVAPAVFAALIAPALLLSSDGGARTLTLGPALPAGVVGAIVAWRSGNVLLTIAAGLATFWVLRALI